jgi:hypothetical protein
MNCIFATGATRESLSAEQRDFMRDPVGLMNNPVNSTFWNRLSGLKGRFFIRHAEDWRFYQNCLRLCMVLRSFGLASALNGCIFNVADIQTPI